MRADRVRNVFDQYTQPENQLTHALASALHFDRDLARRFLRDVAGIREQAPRHLEIIEQGLPGDPPKEEQESKGLPDLCMHDGEGWALLLESKVTSGLTRDQLERHLATARRRGFAKPRLMVVTVKDHRVRLPHGAVDVRWSEIYAWLRRQRRSDWALRAAEYMEVAERRWADLEHLKEGTLTEFAGFPFGLENEYNYPEAKRVLRLAMAELRKNRTLGSALGASCKGEGRPAITGRDAAFVWDFIPLRGAKAGEPFTKRPHLTLSIHSDAVTAFVTFPNQMDRRLRRNLIGLGEDGFFDVVSSVERGLSKSLRRIPGAAPWFRALQRYYPSQRGVPRVDAELQFDLRTALPHRTSRPRGSVAPQDQWLRAAFDTYAHRRCNYQVQIGARFAYQRDSRLASPGAIDLIARSWLACEPILSATLGRR